MLVVLEPRSRFYPPRFKGYMAGDTRTPIVPVKALIDLLSLKLEDAPRPGPQLA